MARSAGLAVSGPDTVSSELSSAVKQNSDGRGLEYIVKSSGLALNGAFRR